MSTNVGQRDKGGDRVRPPNAGSVYVRLSCPSRDSGLRRAVIVELTEVSVSEFIKDDEKTFTASTWSFEPDRGLQVLTNSRRFR